MPIHYNPNEIEEPREGGNDGFEYNFDAPMPAPGWYGAKILKIEEHYTTSGLPGVNVLLGIDGVTADGQPTKRAVKQFAGITWALFGQLVDALSPGQRDSGFWEYENVPRLAPLRARVYPATFNGREYLKLAEVAPAREGAKPVQAPPRPRPTFSPADEEVPF